MAIPSRTTEESATGQRYINQLTSGGKVLFGLEDEGVVAGVCDEEDGEGLILMGLHDEGG